MTGEFRAGHGRQRSRTGREDQADATTERECGLPVEGPRERYTGQSDLYCPARREDTEPDEPRLPTLIDLKTSKRVYETHLLQIRGYTATLRENNRPVEQAIVVALHPEPAYNPQLRPELHYVTGDDLEDYVQQFIEHARTFYRMHAGERFQATVAAK